MVLLAIYVSVGRMLAANLGAMHSGILQEINSRVPFTVAAQGVSGEWHSFTPVIVLSGLRLSVVDNAEPPVELSEGRIGVDVFNSLRTGSLQMTRLALDGLSLRGELTEQGQFRIRGFDGGGQIGEWIREFLLNVELVALRDNRLKLTLPGGEVRDLDLNVLMTRDGSRRRVEANLVSTRGTNITVLADGVGDPFQPELFSGELYLDIESSDLGAVKDMLANKPTWWASGVLDLELWLSWSKGKPSVEARVEARDLRVVGPDQTWQGPLDRVALEASLVERKNRWTLFASDLVVEKGDADLWLPRLQLDAWGDALRLRATEVPLAPISAIVASLESAPASLRDVVSALQPRGQLASLQLSIGDIYKPASDWDLEANFDAVAVESFKGAPGVSSASGYVQIASNGGFVVLDSQQLTLEVPAIYREPLHYDDFHGTIHIDWDAQALSLSSGLITTQGEEGEAHVLFGLNIPLVKNAIGIEMDLLVGLENTHPIHRVKYVPYVLNAALHDWLGSSIGEGLIEQGAFLWRGTFKRDTAPMRTIQLAFNIADTDFNYHQDWPPVTVQDGSILIDDSDVSVWADHATLFESQVEHLSVETWVNKDRQIMLAVDGSLQGPAVDGLSVVNGSALTRVVGGAFKDWKLTGDLQTDLKLQMNLTDKTAGPRVEVATRWRDVGLDIVPGNVPVRALNGEFHYSSARGFSSRDLAGELWGKPLSVSVGQRHLATGDGYDPGSSVLDVALNTNAAMADVQRWLNLKSLAFAQGATTVAINVEVARGESPVLRVDSALVGVSLDLPAPWRKATADEKQLRLEMPLAGGGNLLSLDLGEQLKLKLDVADGVLRAGALAVNEEPAALEAGVLRVTGHAPLMEADEWFRFVADYFTGDPIIAEPQMAARNQSAVPAPQQPVAIVVDQLQADNLVIWGQQLQDVTFSLAIEPTLWRLSFDTDWVRGKLLLAQDDTVSQLDIQYLDLTSMSRLGLASGASKNILELPAIDVTLHDLYQADQRLGDLDFDLRSQGEVLSADNITGELANMNLRAGQAGKLTWRQGPDSQTELKASFHFEDLGQTLAYFGYEKIMETEQGQFDLDLRWPGSPQGVSLLQGQGSAVVKIGRGSFLEAPSGATGALRVVSILNLADIVRRLSLTHMFESGIPFDSVDGEVFLHNGVIEVARMDVQGGSSFQFSGLSDVTTERLDGELVATLPVANNLVWVAALAASLPVAAGVFLVSKVFNKQMNRLTSAVYSIGGTWNDPQVQFDHIFDASSQSLVDTAAKREEVTETSRVEVEAPSSLDPQSPLPSASP